MRFKVGRKTSLRMHKHGTLCTLLLCYVAVQISLIPETTALQTLRLRGGRRLRTTTTTTTPTPSTSTSQQPSSEVTTSLPATPPLSKLPGKALGPRRRRKKIRVRKLRVQKRQGALALLDGEGGNNINEGGGGGGREPLYQEHADEIITPDHYYSPIRRQRMRNTRKLFSQSQGGQLIGQPPIQQQYHHQSSRESHSASNPNLEFRRREKEKRRRYPPATPTSTTDDNNNVDNGEDEYSPQQTQPAPKNYAFAYAVRDDGNVDDNSHSHKEARDGELTMGEYRINLPDGRVQVVRYTAGGDIGYKADVTYEGEGDDHPKKPDLIKKPIPYNTAGNQGYLPPSLSPQQFSTPSPKKYRKKKPKNRYQSYGSPSLIRSTVPSYYTNARDQEEDFGKYGSPQPTPLSSPQERPLAYEDGQGFRQSHPSSTSRPVYRRLRSRPTYENDNYSPAPPTPTAYSRSSDSPSFGRPESKQKRYEEVHLDESKEYDENLAILHDQSPRAGPTRERKNGGGGGRDKNTGSSSAIGGYGYPGHPELEYEIQTLKQTHKPPRPHQKSSFNNPFEQQNFIKKQTKQGLRNIRPSPKPDSSPADLYNEPGPGNYFTAINGPPSSPSPPPPPPRQKKFFNYPKQVGYRNPSTTAAPNYNYIDDHDDGQYRPDNNDKYDETERPTFGSYTPISFKSGSGKELIPIEDFKAGPARKNFKTNNGKKPRHEQKYRQVVNHYYDEENNPIVRAGPSTRPKTLQTKEPESVGYKEPFDYYNSQHPSFHHGGYLPPTAATPTSFPSARPRPQHHQHPSASPSPSTSYTIDFPGGQHSFYLKTGPGSSSKSSSPTPPTPFHKYQQQSQFHHESSPYRSSPSPSPTLPTPRKKPSSSGGGSGLVFFETPGSGPRPTQGVKHLLSQFPNFSGSQPSSPTTPQSFPNTVIHPYEVGRKDYGHSVGYKNSFNTPSSGEDHDSDDHPPKTSTNTEHENNENGLNRDYLFDNGQEIVVASPEFESHRFRSNSPSPSHPPSPSPTPAQQFHYRKSLQSQKSSTLPLPRPGGIVGSTPESFHDYNNEQQNYQLLQPVSPTPAISSSHFHTPIHDYSSINSNISPTNSDYGIDPRHPLTFSAISDDANVLNNSEGGYQYQQYEEGVVK